MGNEALRIYRPVMITHDEDTVETYLIALRSGPEGAPEFGMWKFLGRYEVGELVEEKKTKFGDLDATLYYLKPDAIYIGKVNELNQPQ